MHIPNIPWCLLERLGDRVKIHTQYLTQKRQIVWNMTIFFSFLVVRSQNFSFVRNTCFQIIKVSFFSAPHIFRFNMPFGIVFICWRERLSFIILRKKQKYFKINKLLFVNFIYLGIRENISRRKSLG